MFILSLTFQEDGGAIQYATAIPDENPDFETSEALDDSHKFFGELLLFADDYVGEARFSPRLNYLYQELDSHDYSIQSHLPAWDLSFKSVCRLHSYMYRKIFASCDRCQDHL
jgi:hypothetical protein